MNDASVSLPLLEGLYHRPGASQSVCKDAYRRHVAATRIAVWVSTTFHLSKTTRKAGGNPRKRRKVVARRQPESTVAGTRPKSYKTSDDWQHWIFRALRSESLTVRQVSYGILLKGSMPRLKHVLLDQVNFMLSEPHIPPGGGDYSIQLLVVLTHLVIQKPDELTLFCAGGGLRWIARSILKIVAEVVPTVKDMSPPLGQSRDVADKPYGTLVTIQTRIVLLVDLCFRVVLYTSSPCSKHSKSSKENPTETSSPKPSSRAEKRKRVSTPSTPKNDELDEAQKDALNKRLQALRKMHQLFWSTEIPAVTLDDASLSPLACLICAYEVLKYGYPLTAKIQGMDACLNMLSRLVDPNSQVMASASSGKHSKRKGSRDRRKAAKRGLPALLLRETSSGNDRPSAAAEMARAVSVAMDALENPNESGDLDGDVIMEDVQDGNDETEEQEADDEATQEMEYEDDDDDDDEEEFVQDENDDDDEEVGSECEDVVIDGDENEEEDENDIVVGEDDEDELRRDLDETLDLNRNEPAETTTATETVERDESSLITETNRRRAYVSACMEVLSAHYPHLHSHASPGGTTTTEPVSSKFGGMFPLLRQPAEQSLLKSVCDVVKPPKKPLNVKIFMKRAPTQEEFFRGSLSRNPMSLSSLAKRGSHAGRAAGHEPTVRDLRQHIANDLQMSDSAELLELLVANKILDMNLKLRVVQQVLWKNHLMENSSSSFVSSLLSGQSGHSFLTSGSSLSMVLSATMGRERSGGSRQSITADTPASALPPMVVTYRLAGVDGEATEDHVDEASCPDPEAPSPLESAEAHEQQMEKEYGITRLVVKGRGLNVLLRSVEANISDTLRRIRRDDVGLKRARGGTRRNPSREKFLKSAPCSGLVLLRHGSKLAFNRKKLLEARAPTLLLRLLLDVLSALEGPSEDSADKPSEGKAHTVNNPTADVLKELIEVLASDISPSALLTTAPGTDSQEELVTGAEQDASTLPLLLSSLRTTFLSPPLRKVIGKLLPFLTYGQASLSKDLARNIAEHVTEDSLIDFQADEKSSSQSSVMMDTFVQATIHLPPSDICNSLRTELLDCGFVKRLSEFCVQGIPSRPPPWSPALWSKEQTRDLSKRSRNRKALEEDWRSYFAQSGLRTGFRMLTGLCAGHAATQALISKVGSSSSQAENDGCVKLLEACHWIESTSDNAAAKVNMNGMGILAETLLDEVRDGNEAVSKMVADLRKRSRERKKEIAEERRSRALVGMSSFGPLAGAATAGQVEEDRGSTGVVRDVASSILAPVLGFFRDQSSHAAESGADVPASRAATSEAAAAAKAGRNQDMPSWLAEMEAMEDETGLTCAVCQEGRTLQPTELLGLYTYVKKVSIPVNRCGGPSQIDGSTLLESLPSMLPESLRRTHVDHEYFTPAKEVGRSLRSSRYSSSSISQSKRPTHFVTTVSAGNAIHCTCHSKARSADRNHPKAPKSEWEGAALRNSRVACNAILPLVSSKSSKVNLVAVEIALTDYQTVISNLLGSRPKSMLWTILNDVRFLMLRMSYGEALNADCGGGSLSSNSTLLFHELFMADMFANDAEHDSPETAQHARFLSGGFIAAYEIVNADDYDKDGSSNASLLARSIADAAPMAALCCVLFNNGKDDDVTVPGKERRWEMHKEKFLCGLISCAGRRHALGVVESGCATSRGSKRAMRMRSSSFTDWDVMGNDEPSVESSSSSASKRKPTSILGKRGLPEIDDFASALRPMITFYAIVDQLSEVFHFEMNDEMIEEGSARVVKVVEACQRAKSIHELLQRTKVTLDHERIIEELQKGIVSA